MEENEFKEKMQEKSKILGFDFSVEQISKFYKYMNMLIEWNEKINLTAIIEPNEIILKHFIDSLTIYKDIPNKSSVVDVGTGAGFPSIPIKIVFPNLKFTLVELVHALRGAAHRPPRTRRTGLRSVPRIRAAQPRALPRRRRSVGIGRRRLSFRTAAAARARNRRDARGADRRDPRRRIIELSYMEQIRVTEQASAYDDLQRMSVPKSYLCKFCGRTAQF